MAHGPKKADGKSKAEGSLIQDLRLNFDAGITASPPTSSSDIKTGTRFELKPSYRIPTDTVWVEGLAKLFVSQPENHPRVGGGAGAQVSLLPFRSPDNRLFVGAIGGGVGGGANEVGPVFNPFAGITLFDSLNIQAGYTVQPGHDEFTVTAGVDVLKPFRRREIRQRYDSYFSDNDVSQSTAKEQPERAKFKEDLRAKRQRYLKNLRFLRERGVEIKLAPAVILFSNLPEQVFDNSYEPRLRDSLRQAFADEKPGLLDQRASFSGARPHPWVDLGELSLDFLVEQNTLNIIERDPRLITPAERKMQFSAVTLHVDVHDDHFHVMAWDWFQEEPFFEKTYPLRIKDNFYWDRVEHEIGEVVRAYQADVDFTKRVKNLPPLSADEQRELGSATLYHVNHPTGWSEADIRESQVSWRTLAESFKPTLEAQPYYADVDREGARSSLLYMPLELELTPERLQQTEYRPIEVRGFLDGFRLRTREADPDNPVNSFKFGADSRLKGPFNELVRDQYGNLIFPLAGKHFLTDRPFFMGFNIFPPFVLARSSEEAGKPVTVGVDLARFGFGNHPHLMTTFTIGPKRTADAANPYYLYSTLPPTDASKAEGVYERASQIGSSVEQFFGFKPGEKIQNIFYVPSRSENASVRLANPETIFLWDEIIPRIAQGTGDFVVRHEAYHCLDIQFQVSLHPAMMKIWEKLKDLEDDALFRAINEKYFLKTEFGGHSQDDVLEFFASLTNTLQAPNWEDRVTEMNPRIRGLYYHSLLALKTALKERVPGVEKGPIFAVLQERITALEQHVNAPFESFLLKPTSKLLAEGFPPIPVIRPKDFEREVMKSKEPVIVYLFQESEGQDQIPTVQDVARRYRGKAKVVAVRYQDASMALSDFFGGNLGSSTLNLFKNGKIDYTPDMMETLNTYRDGILNALYERLK